MTGVSIKQWEVCHGCPGSPDHSEREELKRCVEHLTDPEVGWLPGEDFSLQYASEALAVGVGVRSSRPDDLLRQIQKVASPTFHMPAIRRISDRYWTTLTACPVGSHRLRK